MSKALDLLSKGIQKGIQAADNIAEERARRQWEQEEREEAKRERERERLREIAEMNPKYLKSLGLDPDNMTDEELDNWGRGNAPTMTLPSDISDEQIETFLHQMLEQDIESAKEIAENISNRSMLMSDAEIIKELGKIKRIVADIDKETDQYQFVAKRTYQECVKTFGKSRSKEWGHFDFNKPVKIIQAAWEKRYDELMKYVLNRKPLLNPNDLQQLAPYEEEYNARAEQQRKTAEDQRVKREKEKEKQKQQEAERQEQRKIEEAKEAEERAKTAHQMKYHKWVSCGFWAAWLITFIMMFINMEEWYEYVMTAIICIVTGIALGLYTFSTQIVHRNISLVLWAAWTFLMFYSIYDAEWWGYVLAIIIGGIVAVPLFLYQVYQAGKK